MNSKQNYYAARTTRAVAQALLILALSAPAYSQPSGRGDQLRAMNGQALQLQSDTRKTASASSRANAKALLATRAEMMGELIATDPTQAVSVAFPSSVLQQLADTYPEAASSLEQRGRWQGELEYLIEDDVALKSSRSIFKLRGKSETLSLHFVGKEPANLRSGQQIAVRGIKSGKRVAASEVEVMLEQASGSTSTTTSTSGALASAAVCSASGPQKVVSILVNFPNTSLPTVTTPDFVRGVLLGNQYSTSQNSPNWSVDDFWRQNSDGQTYIDAPGSVVVGPVSLPSNFNTDSTGATSCDVYGIRDAAIKAVDGQVDFRQFSRVQIVMPQNGACSWAGTAYIGCVSLSSPGDGAFTGSVAWQRADTMQTRARGVQLTTHEMGHNLGMGHASSRDFGAEAVGALGSAGTLTEYGESHSTMGSWNFGFYVAPQAANRLAWLSSGANYQTIETSGTYTIQNYESRPAGMKALKVRRGSGNDAWLWVESRQNTGVYSSQLDSSLFRGALIHYQDATTSSKSHLLDFTTATSSFTDSALPVGSTWTDPYSNVSVTINGVTANAMTVTVNYGGLTCTQAPPSIVASPTGVATAYGTSTQFNVAIKNNSSSGCAPENFNLSATVPAGWTSAFSVGSVTVGPGQQGQSVLSTAIPVPYALGTYPVTAAARSSASTASASDTENVTVVEPTTRLSLGISGSGTVRFSSPAKSCTTSCVADYPGSASVVTLTAAPASRSVFSGWTGACSGTGTTCTVTMNAAKTVNAAFKRLSGKK